MTPESLDGLTPQEAAARALQWVWATPPNYMNLTAKIDELRAHKTPAQEPVAFLFQHSDTGRTQSIPPNEVDDFERLNPRWIKVGPLYTRPAAMGEALGLLKEARGCIHYYRRAEGADAPKVEYDIAAFLKAHGGEHE